MKKLILLSALLLAPIVLFGQPVIKNAENFQTGTTLVFQGCKAKNVSPGKAGANQIWDFSSLTPKKDEKITEKMVTPQSTKYGKHFPKANLTEKYSSGRYVYMLKKDNGSYLLGFVSPKSNMTIKYDNPMLIAKRPIEFGDTYFDSYSTNYTVRNLDFKGKGTVSIIADGYGKLILPNKTYKNVLRIKITQKEKAAPIKYPSNKFTTKTTIYVWFDQNHTSALLKISKTESSYYNNKSVAYLLSETL